MGKTIEIRRHTDNDGDVLTEDGVTAAMALGRALAVTEWSVVVSTGAQRATQALANLVAATGATAAQGVVVEPGLRSVDEERWRAAYQQAGSGRLGDLRAADPEFVEAEVATLGAALQRVADRLPDGGRALVVGHSPTNEAAILGLTGQEVEPLGKGGGATLVLGDDGWDVTPAGAP